MRIAAGLLLWALAAAAQAQDFDLPGSSVTAGGLFELPDSARDSDSGYGAHLSFAAALPGGNGQGLETDFYYSRRQRNESGHDAQQGIFVNYGKTFGRIGVDDDAYLPSISPYILLGAGAVRDDVRDDAHIVPAIDAGLGLGIPLGRRGLALRSEVRLVGQFNDDSEPGQDFLLDYQLRIGLQIPLGGLSPDDDEVATPAPASDCGVAVVNPRTGRRDCTVDSDHDGVVDVNDLCAGTPPGSPVDGTGCPVSAAFDTDGDGVTDDMDICPGTALGLHTDANGCVASLPAETAPADAPRPTLLLTGLRFARESAELTDVVRAQLDDAARKLSSEAELIVEVAGHTDTSGKPDYNLALSLLRASNVRQYLVGRGISRYRLVVEGYGDARPVASNDTEAGRSQNRRVDIESIDIDVIER